MWQRLELEVRRIAVTDPLAAPMLAELTFEYHSRYGPIDEMSRYPAEEFAPPGGTLLVLIEREQAIAGGAFRRYDETTAELKRVWTLLARRRQGLARLVLRALETEAADRGYRRIFLTTGPRQLEARALYLNTGYRPLFDVDADPETIGLLAFEKLLLVEVPVVPAQQTGSVRKGQLGLRGCVEPWAYW